MKMYEVGGCVRDEILGLRSKDIDFSVVLEGNEGPFLGADPFRKMEYELEKMGFKIFLSTPEYFTVRAQFPKTDSVVTMEFASQQTDPEDATIWTPVSPRTMDISSYQGMTADFVLARKEGEYIDGRRPDRVEIGTLEDDLARRDFTMNAIAKDENGYYTDPYNGRQDIRDGIIRAVGDPMDRFTEDALRAVRALRFGVTKQMQIDDDVQKAMQSAQVLVALRDNISDERIQQELSKMFRFDTVNSLRALGMFPQLTNAIFSGTVSLDATMKTKGRSGSKGLTD